MDSALRTGVASSTPHDATGEPAQPQPQTDLAPLQTAQPRVTSQPEKEEDFTAKVAKIRRGSEEQHQLSSEHNYKFHVGDEIVNQKKSMVYTALQLLGKGTFGQVLLVRRSTGHRMALKVFKRQPAYINQGMLEVKLLREIAAMEKQTNGCKENYLNIYDAFMWNGYLCVAMEQMDNSLLDILTESNYTGLEMKWIEMWTKDLLLTLAKIHALGIYHCDIKPENIMFRPERPQKPLLIDFSSSCSKTLQPFTYFQSRFYRSPQVIFGIKPFTGKIDIWSLGCLLGELYLGLPILPGACVYDQVSKIFLLLRDRLPYPEVIENSTNGKAFFKILPKPISQAKESEEDGSTNELQQPELDLLVLKSAQEYEQETAERVTENPSYFEAKELDDFLRERNPPLKDIQTHELFLDLLKRMLVVDPEERISAEEAFLHPFVGGMHSELEQLRLVEQMTLQ